MDNHLWEIDLYVNQDGVCYADDDFFKPLSKKNKLLLESLFKKQEKLQSDVSIDNLKKIGDLEHVRDGIWEMKFHLKQQVRYLGCLSGDETTFYILAAFIKKDQKVKERHIQKAIKRLAYFVII